MPANEGPPPDAATVPPPLATGPASQATGPSSRAASPSSPTTAPPTPVDATPPREAAPAEERRRGGGILRRVLLAGLAAAVLWGLWVLSLQFVAYTSDAFVATDVLEVAPEVGGHIAAVRVVDDQVVRAGDPLIEIDPTPYALQVALRTAELAKAKADEQTAIRDVARAEAELATRKEAFALARRTERRFADLVGKGAASQLTFDEASTKMREAEKAVRAAEASLEAAQQAVVAQQAAGVVAARALELARWDLSQTKIVAPIDGWVNNLWLRVGDYARAGEPRLGIVASDRWMVIALYKEEAIRHLVEGGTVWIQLDIYPWRLFRGHIRGVTRGIGRELRQTAILPEIAPTTGWIRFQRRFPVRIEFDEVPDDVRLHVGANARTLAVYGW